MDTRTSFIRPFVLFSTHLVFLTKKRAPDEATDFRTIEIEGANIRLSPFGNEKTPEGKTTAEQVRSLVRTSIAYWTLQEKKYNDFLRSISDEAKGPNQAPESMFGK